MPDQTKVAILKSRLYRGGVAQVLGYMIKSLNDSGIVPDLLVLRSDLDSKDFSKLYQIDIRFKIKFIGPDIKMPYEWHFLYFNLLSRPYAKKYDLFINSNNTSFLAPTNVRTLTYIHFPRKFRVMSDCSSTHFPESKDKSFWDIRNDPFRLAQLLYRFNVGFGKKEKIIANSIYTAQQIKESYPLIEKIPDVIYPPIPVPQKPTLPKKLQIMTLGRISAEKRQLEQIEVAKHFPEIDFYILGFTDFKEYYQKCSNKIKESNLKNVHLMVNLNFSEIEKTLSESKYFLHCVRNEPFGISTIQALNHGCIPLVHHSGGSSEIVLQDKFMFENQEDCTHKLKNLLTTHPEEISESIKSFNLKKYSADSFIEKFHSLIVENLS